MATFSVGGDGRERVLGPDRRTPSPALVDASRCNRGSTWWGVAADIASVVLAMDRSARPICIQTHESQSLDSVVD